MHKIIKYFFVLLIIGFFSSGCGCSGDCPEDTTPPVITLNGADKITLEQGEKYQELGANADDDKDTNVKVTIKGEVDTSKIGTYTITYIAKDKAGNKAEKTRTIIVIASKNKKQQYHYGSQGISQKELEKIPTINDLINSGAENETEKIPTSFDLSDKMPPVGDQGHQGSCEAWAIGYYIKSYQEAKERQDFQYNDTVLYSPAYLYNYTNAYVLHNEGKSCLHEGTRDNDAFDFLIGKLSNYTNKNIEGIVSLDDLAYNEKQCKYDLSNRSWSQEPICARISSVATIYKHNGSEEDKSILAIKRFLSKGNPLLLTIKVYPNNIDGKKLSLTKLTTSNHKGELIYSKVIEDKNVSGHAIVLVGYDDSIKAFKIINSWGTEWGNKGYLWIPYDTFKKVAKYVFLLSDAKSNCGIKKPLFVTNTQVLHFNATFIDKHEQTSMNIVVYNNGNKDGTLKIEGPYKQVFKIDKVSKDMNSNNVLNDNSFIVPKGEKRYIQVTFAPTEAKEYTDYIKLIDEENNNNIKVILKGEGAIKDNQPPIADAGNDKEVFLGDEVILDASKSHDPDGFIEQYKWSENNEILSTDKIYKLQNLAKGLHIIQLTVVDNRGAKRSTTIRVLVKENKAPIANAGRDQNIKEGDVITLDGSGSYDPDGQIIKYIWKENNIKIGEGKQITKQFEVGTHTITLIVEDDKGKTSSDNVIITVKKHNPTPLPEPMKIETYTINNISETDTTQTYEITISLSKKPKLLALESDKGNRYEFLSMGEDAYHIPNNGKGVFQSINSSNDAKMLTIIFRLYKESQTVTKSFKLIVSDSNKVDYKTLTYILNPKPNNKIYGIDVHDDKGTIPWKSIKNANIKFAFVKATEGYADESFPESKAFDSKFDENIQGALDNNIYVGAYHLLRPSYNESEDGAKKEANYFISKIKNYYQEYKLLPPALDLEQEEVNSYLLNHTKEELNNWLKAFINKIESQLSIKPIIYLSNSSIDKLQNDILDNYGLWIARYAYSNQEVDDIDNIQDYEPTRTYKFWQFSSTSKVADMYPIDKDYFNGSIDELKALLVKAKSTPDNKPYFESVSLPSSVKVNEKIYFSGYAKDDKGLKNIKMYAIKNGSTELIVNEAISGTSKSLSSYYFKKSTAGSYKVELVITDTANQTASKTFDVAVKSVVQTPAISSLSKSNLIPSDSLQELYIYGSNFSNSDIVEVNYGSGWVTLSRVTNINSSTKRVYIKTTTRGSGTWYIKVKNSAGKYSNTASFTVKPESTPIPGDAVNALINANKKHITDDAGKWGGQCKAYLQRVFNAEASNYIINGHKPTMPLNDTSNNSKRWKENDSFIVIGSYDAGYSQYQNKQNILKLLKKAKKGDYLQMYWNPNSHRKILTPHTVVFLQDVSSDENHLNWGDSNLNKQEIVRVGRKYPWGSTKTLDSLANYLSNEYCTNTCGATLYRINSNLEIK